MSILDDLAAHAKERVAQAKALKPLEQLQAEVRALPKGNFTFRKALQQEGLSFICECKKASPSKGLIAANFPYVEIAKAYEAAGATAISVLTEPKWFLGSKQYLQEISAVVNLPCLRKDFTVDAYMIYEAKLLGAAAVLLICSILSDEQLKNYQDICQQLGMDAVVEAHNEGEVQRALKSGAKIIGVNNRNLQDFSVDTSNSAKLRQLIPPEIIFISESGIKNKADVEAARSMGADAVLVGEALMRSAHIGATLQEWKSL